MLGKNYRSFCYKTLCKKYIPLIFPRGKTSKALLSNMDRISKEVFHIPYFKLGICRKKEIWILGGNKWKQILYLMNIAEYSNTDAWQKQDFCNSKSTLNLRSIFFWKIHLAQSWKMLREEVIYFKKIQKEENKTDCLPSKVIDHFKSGVKSIKQQILLTPQGTDGCSR